MAINPFETPSPTDENLGDTVSRVMRESVHASKSTSSPGVFSEAKEFAKAASNLHGQYQMARKKRDSFWLGKLQAFAEKLWEALWGFIKSAFEIGIIKMIIELCAMAMMKLVEVLTNKGKKIEISTPGVYYSLQNQPASQEVPHQQAMNNRSDPFASYNRPSAVSPW